MIRPKRNSLMSSLLKRMKNLAEERDGLFVHMQNLFCMALCGFGRQRTNAQLPDQLAKLPSVSEGADCRISWVNAFGWQTYRDFSTAIGSVGDR